MRGLCCHEAGLEAGAGLDSGPGQAFGERVVMAGPGRHRTRDQQLGAAAAAHEPQRRHFQGIRLAAGTDGLDHVGQRPGNGPLATSADTGAHHVPVHRVGQADLDPAAVGAAGDQTLVFESVDRGRIGQPGQLGQPEWFAQGEQLEHGPLGLAQVTQAQRHQFDQTDRGGRRALKTPQAPRLDKGPGLKRTIDQLPQEHRVSPAAPGELAHRRRIHRSPERRGQQLLDRFVIEGTDLDAFGRTVLPQQEDGVRQHLAGAHRGEHGSRLGQGHLVHEDGRSLVKQMGVVNEDQERTPPGIFGHRPGVAPEQYPEILSRRVRSAAFGGQQ